MGSITGGLRAVERLAALQPLTVVTGHGVVCGPEVFRANSDYLRWLTDLAVAGRAAGLRPLDVARQCDLGEFADLLDAERIVGNLHRAYAELAGADPGVPLDVVAVFAEIIEFNGGRRPQCLA
jgi:cyclase